METSNGKRKTISEWILKAIRNGELSTGERIPSEYDLAERFGVNKLTANSAVEELVVKGFLERRPGGGGTVVRFPAAFFKGAIAVVAGAPKISYYIHLLRGVQQGAASYGYNTLLYTSLVNDDPEMTRQFFRMSNAAGVIIMNFFHLSGLELPTLWLDKNSIPEIPPGFNHIHHNDADGGRMLARHLLSLGHRKIIYVCQYGNVLHERAKGFTDELEANSVKLLAKEQYFNSGLSAGDYVKQLLRRFPEATAIACDGDNVAFDFYWNLKKAGVRIPEDLSLTGFSGFQEIRSSVKLTTVDEKPFDMGFRAAELMASIIEKRIAVPVDEAFAVDFIHGETTGPVRAAEKATIS